MTLTGVARALDLDPSSVTYYFRKKDDLAFACLERSLAWMRDEALRASAAGTPEAVVRRFVDAHLALYGAGRDADAPKLAILSDMHAMGEAGRQALSRLYVESADALRQGLGIADPTRALVATLALLSTVHWIPSWIGSYAPDDVPRVSERLTDILLGGLAVAMPADGVAHAPKEPGGGDAQSRFLLAATTLINREGYHGASVEKIAAELGVSIGSFYHHLDNKDELVLACFDRSFALIGRARQIGEAGGGGHGVELARTFASLLRLQTEGDRPLLRSSAYQALPPELRERMLRRTLHATMHFAGKIADGVIEGSVRPVDPLLAGHYFVSLINAAADLRAWTTAATIGRFAPDFLLVMSSGLLPRRQA